jgi:peptidoglycan/xylan/chitin deacetylase (PgdA/CDA1 family)
MEIQVVSLAQAAEAPPSGAALTLDGGHRETYTTVYPILAHRGLTATVYVATGFVSSGRRTGSGGAGMTWSMLRELSEAGWTVGSHGVFHRGLVGLPDQELERELVESRTALADSLGRPCRHFSAPGGAMDRRVLDAVQAAGYATAALSLPARPELPGGAGVVYRSELRRNTPWWLFRAKARGWEVRIRGPRAHTRFRPAEPGFD